MECKTIRQHSSQLTAGHPWQRPLQVKGLAIKSLFKWWEENDTTVWHPVYLLTNQAEGSRQVRLHGYPEKMQEGARLRHARQGNQSSHIVSAVLSFTQRANMPVTLRNHLWRVLFIAQLYSSTTRQPAYKGWSKMWFPEALSQYEQAFSIISPSPRMEDHQVANGFWCCWFFLKKRSECERSDHTRVLPFLTSSSLSKTCARLGSSESTNHIGGVDG